MPKTEPELPILRRFPELSVVPRAALGTFPTPVQRLALGDGRVLLVKRDDRCGDPIGGNKVRGLEWLLGGVRLGDHMLTVGPAGSTHALSTAVYARGLGAATTVVRWRQEMNPAARRVAQRLSAAATIIDARWVASAYALAAAIRLSRRVTWIPAGGAATVALLGSVNAALELADQIERGESPEPRHLFVPLGSGGTAAGLALGMRIAGLRTRLVAVRVVPRVMGRAGRIVSLANAAAAYIERITRRALPRLHRRDVHVDHGRYGGAYGRPLGWTGDEGPARAAGIHLDDTYSRKAYAAAASERDDTAMLWLTFDGRLLQD